WPPVSAGRAPGCARPRDFSRSAILPGADLPMLRQPRRSHPHCWSRQLHVAAMHALIAAPQRWALHAPQSGPVHAPVAMHCWNTQPWNASSALDDFSQVLTAHCSAASARVADCMQPRVWPQVAVPENTEPEPGAAQRSWPKSMRGQYAPISMHISFSVLFWPSMTATPVVSRYSHW